jgi:hypothetical protein
VPDGERDIFETDSFRRGRRGGLAALAVTGQGGAAADQNKIRLRRVPRKRRDPLRHGSMNSF